MRVRNSPGPLSSPLRRKGSQGSYHPEQKNDSESFSLRGDPPEPGEPQQVQRGARGGAGRQQGSVMALIVGMKLRLTYIYIYYMCVCDAHIYIYIYMSYGSSIGVTSAPHMNAVGWFRQKSALLLRISDLRFCDC